MHLYFVQFSSYSFHF